MKKIFAWLAVVPLTIATESMIYPVWAECQPDRYGNIIDLGDGNCGQKIELQPPDAQRLIWDQSTVSDIYFPDWIGPERNRPCSFVHFAPSPSFGHRFVKSLFAANSLKARSFAPLSFGCPVVLFAASIVTGKQIGRAHV